MAESVLKECSNNLTGKPQYYLMDAGYDHKVLYELIRKDYQVQAIVPLNHRGEKEPKEGFGWDDTPICSAGYRMTYWGGSNGVNKFRCPHIMRKCDCPFGTSWCSDSNYGMVLKPGPDNIPGYFVHFIGELPTGNTCTTRKPV